MPGPRIPHASNFSPEKASTSARTSNQSLAEVGTHSVETLDTILQGQLLSEEERQKKGIELKKYMAWVKDEVDRENSCLQLPQTIVLLVCFCMLALLHLKQDKVFAIEGALRFDIEENANFAWSHNFGHKVIFDVNSIADFWSWLHIGFLPLVVQHSWGYSEDLQSAYNVLSASGNGTTPYSTDRLPGHFGWPDHPNVKIPVRDDLLHYNRIIGGIRLRQERAERSYDLCRIPGNVPKELWQSWLGKPCMPAASALEETPEVDHAEAFGEAKRVEWLATIRDSLQQLQQQVIDMEDGCSQLDRKNRNGACLCSTCSEDTQDGFYYPWLDEQTSRVEIGFVSYNAEYGLLSLTTASFFFTRGGRIHKIVHVQSAWADHFAGDIFDVGTMIICDITWFSLLLYVLFNEVKEIVHLLRSSKDRWWRTLKDEYFEFWNIVDWISIFLALFVVQMFAQVLFTTHAVVHEFEEIVGKNLQSLSRAEFTDTMQNFMASMESLCVTERWYRVSFCFYPMAVMLRLFKSFAAQGRLAIVTRTLTRSLVDMVHFFMVFMSVFFCMVVNSVLIFGQDIEDYSNMTRATMTCFRNMFGDWDWGGMDEGSLWLSGMWFWAFVIIIVVLLLGFLLAILMDAFGVEKEKALEEQTLMKQIDNMMRRRSMNKAKERVKLNAIFDSYLQKFNNDEKAMLDSDLYITPEDAMEQVDGLRIEQAERTMKNAKDANAPEPPEYTLENVKKDLEIVNTRTQTIRNGVQNIRNTIFRYDTDSDYTHKTFDHELEKAVPPRTRIIDTVREEVNSLAIDVSRELDNEVEIFTQQHRELETHNRNMLACMTDITRVMEEIKEQTEQTRLAIQRQASLEQRKKHALERAKEIKRAANGTFAGCMGPTTMPATPM